MSSSQKACCSIPIVASNYEPVRTVEALKSDTIPEIPLYAVGPKQQFCDIVATYGNCKIVPPDIFRGKPWDPTNIRPDINLTREWLEIQGVVQSGLVGFCWGGHIAVKLIDEGSFFGGASLIHPSVINVKDAENAAASILALSSKDELDMTEYMEILAKKPFGAQCKYRRFEDMRHGFCVARDDYSDELVRKRATEAIRLTTGFFNKILTNTGI